MALSPDDFLIINRGNQAYKLKSENLMAKLLDTDWLLLNRNNQTYKISGADVRGEFDSGKAPIISSVTLADSPEAGRFTNGTFSTAVTMSDPGSPVATKGVKAYVEGSLKSSAETSAITAIVDGPSTAVLSGFEIYGYNSPPISTKKAEVINGAYNATLTNKGNAFDGDSNSAARIEMHNGGPVNPVYMYVFFPRSLPGTNVKIRLRVHCMADTNPALIQPFTHNKDTDAIPPYGVQPDWGVNQNDSIVEKVFVSNPAIDGFAITSGNAPGWDTPFWYELFEVTVNGTPLQENHPGPVAATKVLTFSTAAEFSSINVGDVVTEIGGFSDGSGVVVEKDVAARTITIGNVSGTWNVGSRLKGKPTVSGTVRLYCNLDAGLFAGGLSSSDPGFTPVTGAGPYTVTFPPTWPPGEAPDTTCPVGTSITVEVEAANAKGTVHATSNTIVPA